jgi:hypothetical protein
MAVMDIYTTFEKSMVSVVDKVCKELEIDCIPIVSHQNGPEPTRNYVAINTLMMVAAGKADASPGSYDSGKSKMFQETVQNYEVHVQLTFFGAKSAENAMGYFSQYSGNTAVRETYLRNNLSPRRRSDLRRSPQLREGVWVNSFSFDLILGFAVKTVQEVDWADYVVINGQTITLP